MADHDPMCPGTRKEWNGPREYHYVCDCALIAHVVERERSTMDAREASARADERERAYPGREVRSQLIRAYAQLSHAEPVAARLVEVICEQHWELGFVYERHDLLTEERDAARAEVDGMADALDIAKAERDAARAEVAALRKQEWAAPYRREVLADLRAKVEAYAPGEKRIARREILALLDEAQP